MRQCRAVHKKPGVVVVVLVEWGRAMKKKMKKKKKSKEKKKKRKKKRRKKKKKKKKQLLDILDWRLLHLQDSFIFNRDIANDPIDGIVVVVVVVIVVSFLLPLLHPLIFKPFGEDMGLKCWSTANWLWHCWTDEVVKEVVTANWTRCSCCCCCCCCCC